MGSADAALRAQKEEVGLATLKSLELVTKTLSFDFGHFLLWFETLHIACLGFIV